VSSPV